MDCRYFSGGRASRWRGLLRVWDAGQGIGLTSTSSETSIQTAIARRGDLIVYASGVGQLVALDETSLQFDENGTLIDLLVSVGDQVSAGDVIARLQVNKSETQLAADITKTELALVEDQQALDALYADAEIIAAQALFDLEKAQQELADLQNNDLQVAQAMLAVADAEAAVKDAEIMFYIYNSSPSEEDIYTAYASLLFKEKELNELKDQLAQLEYDYKKAKGRAARDRVKAHIERVTAQMYNQQIVVEQALYRYETIDDPSDALDLNLAQARLDTAQAQLVQANLDLEEAQLGAPTGDIALAEAKVAEAQVEWERWKDGPDPRNVSLAETQLEISQLALDMVRQENLIVDLIAPMDGTVMSTEVAVNEYVNGGAIITLADASQLLLEVSLDETDFQSAQVGNQVEAIFDVLPDNTFSGSILDVSPTLESTFGSQAIKALAVLDETSSGKTVSLPLGMNASVDVIAGEATNAVLVPIEALNQTNSGSYTIYVQVKDIFEPRHVTVGLMDYTSAEVTSGLEPGEIVATGIVKTE